MSKKPSTLTEGDVEAIRQLYAQGNFTYKELGKIFNLHSTTIGRMVNGQTFRKIQMADRPKKRLTLEERALIITLTNETFLTNREIMDKVGCSEFTIRYHRRQARKGAWV